MVLHRSISSIIFCLTALESSYAFNQSNFNARPVISGRIINGRLANVKETEHQVSIRYGSRNIESSSHVCGGSLIAPNVVLSAAHCFAQKNGTYKSHTHYNVAMGSLSVSKISPLTLFYDIKKIFYGNSSFNMSTFTNDIALLILNGSVPAWHSTVQPIAINRGQMPAGTICQVTGWGMTEHNSLPDLLRTANVSYIDKKVCVKKSKYKPGTLKEGMLCAGDLMHGDQDACAGDSGGPLICKDTLTGIVSFGSHCGRPWLPGVYTDVAYWASWIDKSLAAENITLLG